MAKVKSDHSSDPLAEPLAFPEGGDLPGEMVAARKKKAPKKRKYNKTQLVRDALEALGDDASNEQILTWIQDERHITLDAGRISNIKSNVLRSNREDSGKKSANGPGRTSAAKAAVTLSVADMRLVKELIARIGPAGLHEVVDLFKS